MLDPASLSPPPVEELRALIDDEDDHVWVAAQCRIQPGQHLRYGVS
jgi:hypothetical protein